MNEAQIITLCVIIVLSLLLGLGAGSCIVSGETDFVPAVWGVVMFIVLVAGAVNLVVLLIKNF